MMRFAIAVPRLNQLAQSGLNRHGHRHRQLLMSGPVAFASMTAMANLDDP
jgi:hypothetical protein